MSTRRFELVLSVLMDLRPSSPSEGNIRQPFTLNEVWGDGSGDNKVNAGPHRSTRTLASAANEDIDLKALTDGEGNAIDVDEVAFLVVYNPPSNDGDLTISPASSNGWPFLGGTSPTLPIPPGGVVVLTNPQAGEGVAVGASTDTINVANGGSASVDYEFGVVGRT